MARILVVDDEPIIAMTVADWLGDLGHVALGPAGDLKTAFALAEEALDAVILDVSLGAETTIALAERLLERGVPFAVASGHDAQALGAAFAAGLWMPKPFLFETLRHVVERLLGPRG
jgi:CheY-like chemotaxis protein